MNPQRSSTIRALLFSRALGLLVTVLVFSDSASAQCPLCRGVIFRSKEGQQLIGGFDHAVLFLLGVPFLLVALFAARIAKSQRTHLKDKAREDLASTLF